MRPNSYLIWIHSGDTGRIIWGRRTGRDGSGDTWGVGRKAGRGTGRGMGWGTDNTGSTFFYPVGHGWVIFLLVFFSIIVILSILHLWYYKPLGKVGLTLNFAEKYVGFKNKFIKKKPSDLGVTKTNSHFRLFATIQTGLNTVQKSESSYPRTFQQIYVLTLYSLLAG